jgi:hypothetical protein
VQTCPNDRQQFNNILVRLQLDGEVVRKIPVQAQNKDEDNVLLDVTECQVILLYLLLVKFYQTFL